MDIQEFLSRLHVEHHNSASGEYTCRCPAHDDRTASLTVNVQSSRYNGRRESCSSATLDAAKRTC